MAGKRKGFEVAIEWDGRPRPLQAQPTKDKDFALFLFYREQAHRAEAEGEKAIAAFCESAQRGLMQRIIRLDPGLGAVLRVHSMVEALGIEREPKAGPELNARWRAWLNKVREARARLKLDHLCEVWRHLTKARGTLVDAELDPEMAKAICKTPIDDALVKLEGFCFQVLADPWASHDVFRDNVLAYLRMHALSNREVAGIWGGRDTADSVKTAVARIGKRSSRLPRTHLRTEAFDPEMTMEQFMERWKAFGNKQARP